MMKYFKIKQLAAIFFLSTVAIGQNNARMTQKEVLNIDSAKNKNQLSIAEGVFQPNWR